MHISQDTSSNEIRKVKVNWRKTQFAYVELNFIWQLTATSIAFIVPFKIATHSISTFVLLFRFLCSKSRQRVCCSSRRAIISKQRNVITDWIGMMKFHSIPMLLNINFISMHAAEPSPPPNENFYRRFVRRYVLSAPRKNPFSYEIYRGNKFMDLHWNRIWLKLHILNALAY